MPTRGKRQYKKAPVSRALNYYGKGFAKNAKFIGKTVSKGLGNAVKGAKYLPIVGGLMGAQYKAYESYLKDRRIVNPRSKASTTGGQWSSTSVKYNLAKPVTKTKQTSKLVNTSKSSIIYRWNGVNGYSTGNGFYWLQNFEGTPLTRNLPLYAFDLTGCINASTSPTNALQVRRATPMTMMFQDIPAGDVQFINSSHLQRDGVTSTTSLQMEYSTGGGASGDGQTPYSTSSFPMSKDILKWADIRLNCYGCKNSATKYKILVVRFTDRDLLPDPSVGGNQKRTSLFQALIKPLVFSPISTTYSPYSKRMQVLKKMEFIIQDQSSDSIDTDPHNKVVKMFLNLNRICDYKERANILNTTDTTDQADFVVNAGSQNNEYVQPTSRLYLIVTASNFGRDIELTTTGTPSFDMSIRLKHENLN